MPNYKKLPRFYGRQPATKAQNALIDAINANGSLRVAIGSTLRLHDSPIGRLIAKEGFEPIEAIITGGSNPYSWDFAAHTSSGPIDLAPGGTTSNMPAYEINGDTHVPAGSAVILYQGSGTDVRFQYRRLGCGSGTINVFATSCGVSLSGVPTVSVSVTDPHGTVVGSCTGLPCSVNVPVGATYTVTVTGDCGSGSANVTISNCTPQNVNVVVPGGTVTVTQNWALCATNGASGSLNGPHGYSATITGDAHQTICVPFNGTYTAHFTNDPISWLPCYNAVPDIPVTVSGCSGSLTVTASPRLWTYTINVTGCNLLPLEGATVTVTGPGGYSWSGTTDANGQAFPTNLVGHCTYTVTVTYPLFSVAKVCTFTVTCLSGRVFSCGFGTNTPPVSGYTCTGCCPNPFPNALTLTYDIGGPVTITYTTAVGGLPGWGGARSRRHPSRRTVSEASSARATASQEQRSATRRLGRRPSNGSSISVAHSSRAGRRARRRSLVSAIISPPAAFATPWRPPA
jgi:hypothetical protein